MSHSKVNKKGKSLYIDKWNKSAKNFINTCVICGAKGYSPTIDEDGFIYDNANNIENFEHRAIRQELKSVLSPLSLDELGRCPTCAKLMDKDN